MGKAKLPNEITPFLPGATIEHDAPKDLTEICPLEMVKMIMDLPKEYLGYTPHRLLERYLTGKNSKNLLQKQKVAEILRHAFWLEYDEAVDTRRRMNLMKICRGRLAKESFLLQMGNEFLLAYVISAPESYQGTVLSLLDKATNKLYEILDQPIMRRICRCRNTCICEKVDRCRCDHHCVCTPQFDHKLAETVSKMHARLEMRAKGALLQRVSVDKRSLIAQVTSEIPGMMAGMEQKLKDKYNIDDPLTIEEINEKILKLEEVAEKAVDDMPTDSSIARAEIRRMVEQEGILGDDEEES